MRITRRFPVIGLLVLLVAGCSPTIVNNTPNPLPINPSGIYTMSMSVRSEDGSVLKKSYAPSVVIGGQSYPMNRISESENTFEYDFQMPEGVTEAKYFYLLDYQTSYDGTPSPQQTKSELYELKLINRYVISLASYRGPVGAQIPVVGSGFSRYDKVFLGGVETETQYASSNSLSFRVPTVKAGLSYTVELAGANGRQIIGTFAVDPARLRVSPQRIFFGPGEKTVMAFTIDFPAPESGIPIDVKTNVPASVIMPDVFIAPGETSVSVPVKAGKFGSGFLVISAEGFTEQRVEFVVGNGSSSSGSVYNPDEASYLNR